METGQGFRFCGHVVRKMTNPQGTWGLVVLDVPTERGTTSKYEVRAFAGDALNEIAKLRDGAKVQITGRVDMETLKDKSKNDVKVDGRSVWVPRFTARTVTVDPASKQPEPAKSEDKLPEGW